MSSTKVHFTLSDEALAIINANATPNKRGQWVSDVILAYAQITGAIEPISLDCGLQEQNAMELTILRQQQAAILRRLNGSTLPTISNGAEQ